MCGRRVGRRLKATGIATATATPPCANIVPPEMTHLINCYCTERTDWVARRGGSRLPPPHQTLVREHYILSSLVPYTPGLGLCQQHAKRSRARLFQGVHIAPSLVCAFFFFLCGWCVLHRVSYKPDRQPSGGVERRRSLYTCRVRAIAGNTPVHLI